MSRNPTTALRARLDRLEAEVAAGRQQLRAALVAGQPTGALREHLAAAVRERADVADQLAAAYADADAAAGVALAAAARAIAENVAARLAEHDAALTVPAAPAETATQSRRR